jgi:CelD/BcsL family acetyltransferase involved in cellulose biosynthesis
MEPHDRWTTRGFDLEPVADRTGPFVHRDVLKVWWNHFGGDGVLQFVESDTGFLPLCTWGGAVRFVGEGDLTDYHSPLGSDTADLVAAYVAGLEKGTILHLDSLPREAAEAVGKGLTAAGLEVVPIEHEVAAVLDLPASFDGWLASLSRKQRHEVRRKLRRFEEAGGVARLEHHSGPDAIATFSRLHRKADGDKAEFMTEAMESFFTSLHDEAGGRIDVLEGPDGSPVAAAFGFEDDDTYYLYNSGYDPEARDLSPGIVMLAALIRRAVSSGKQVFDFLKGDEAYKARHGAHARPLYEFKAVVGGLE